MMGDMIIDQARCNLDATVARDPGKTFEKKIDSDSDQGNSGKLSH